MRTKAIMTGGGGSTGKGGERHIIRLRDREADRTMRIGVLLGGCGHYDGTDVHEAVLTFLALEAAGEKPVLLAPDIEQDRTVDHLSGEEVQGERRGVLRESARLARGGIRTLAECRPEELEALIIPGGYGPVVNFSTGFARPGQARGLVPEVAEFIRHFLDHGKPIGLISLGEIPVRTLLGQEIEIAPSQADPRAPAIDRERLLVHTPGFTAFKRLADVRTGIEAMVAEILRLMERRARPEGASDAARGER
jgi:enhancing lycopene biosynthesis protein 2